MKDKIVIFIDSNGSVESIYSNLEPIIPIEVEVIYMSELDTNVHYVNCKHNLNVGGFKNIY